MQNFCGCILTKGIWVWSQPHLYIAIATRLISVQLTFDFDFTKLHQVVYTSWFSTLYLVLQYRIMIFICYITNKTLYCFLLRWYYENRILLPVPSTINTNARSLTTSLIFQFFCEIWRHAMCFYWLVIYSSLILVVR